MIATFFTLPLVSHAQIEGEDAPRGKIIKIREERNNSNGCDNRKNMIDNRIKMFGVSEKFHKEKYSRIYDRISSLIERLDAQEVDTSKLKSDLEVLKGKIDTLKTNYDTLMGKLEALKDTDCEDIASNKTSLDEIRELLKELKNDAKDIREFFVNTIKPDLKELRKDN